MVSISISANIMFHFLNTITLNSLAVLLCSTLTILVLYRLISKRSGEVFLVDFACYKPPINQSVTIDRATDIFINCSNFTEETIQFIKKIHSLAGLGDSTYLSATYLKSPPNFCLEEAKNEAQMVIIGVVDELLAKSKVRCEDIGILVVNSSIFCVTPSLSSIIVNRYKLKDNISSYNLSGMSCAASLLAINLDKNLLQVHPNTYALVVSTENVTQNIYSGNDRSKILGNCVLRLAGAAILLSNRLSDHSSSKYQLLHVVQNNTSSSDFSYNTIFYDEDLEGYLGLTISKNLLAAAIMTIRPNIASLGSLFLPVSVKFQNILKRIVIYVHLVESKPLTHDFKKIFDHFLPHGGKPVLDEVQRSLSLPENSTEASRMTLYRFGNTYSSSIWYELAYLEAKKRIKKGNCVWQMAYGSGFKCCSVVWRAIRAVDLEEMNPWKDEIDEFPVDVSKIELYPIFSGPE